MKSTPINSFEFWFTARFFVFEAFMLLINDFPPFTNNLYIYFSRSYPEQCQATDSEGKAFYIFLYIFFIRLRKGEYFPLRFINYNKLSVSFYTVRPRKTHHPFIFFHTVNFAFSTFIAWAEAAGTESRKAIFRRKTPVPSCTSNWIIRLNDIFIHNI